MAISLDDDAVLLDSGVRMKFLRDAEYSPAPPMVALAGDTQTLLQCTPEGRLKIDTSVTIDTVDIGDVDVRGKDAGGVSQYFQVVLDPVISRYAMVVNDPRMGFTAGRLNVDATLAFPSDYPDAGTHSRLDTLNAKDFATEATLAAIKAKTDNIDVALSSRTKPSDQQHVIIDSSASIAVTGPLTDAQLRATPVPVSGAVTADVSDRTARELGRVLASDILYASEAYITTNVFALARVLDVRNFKTKEIVIKNSGANGARVNILASVDGGTNYDITISSNTAIGSGNTMAVGETRAFTHIKIEAKSSSAGNSTTLDTRGYALGS